MSRLTDAERVRAVALWRSEDEDGPERPLSAPGVGPLDNIPLNNVEWIQLRIRVIALENLAIALLADAPARQQGLAREMATYISPRPGFTPHPLTLRAADEMLSLVDRAGRFSNPSVP